MEQRIIYHGSQEIVTHPEIRQSRFNKDFSSGFYCTIMKEQAVRWATRFPGAGYVSEFFYHPNPSLRTKVFEQMTEEWLDFVVDCRRGIKHDYDIVEGPMADDQIWDYVEEFVSGRISREAFWELVKFRHPTHQIVFCTAEALKTIRYERSETL